jgi:hypothetical protein
MGDLAITAFVTKDCEVCGDMIRDLRVIDGDCWKSIESIVDIGSDIQAGLRAAITRVPYFTAHRGDILVGTKLGYKDPNDFAEWRREVGKVQLDG